MICAIEGVLLSLRENVAVVRPGGSGLSYEVLLPVYAVERFASRVGQTVELVIRHDIESQSQGAILVPRLIGFGSLEERAFFEVFTTVKGLGPKRAVRALARPPGEIASAIARRDHAWLQELPEIGKKLAETMVVDLSSKVQRFIVFEGGRVETKPRAVRGSAAEEAAAALVALGQSPLEASRLVDRALADAADRGAAMESADAIITAALSGGR
jgi:Holliday junction DNA helicase RuvA